MESSIWLMLILCFGVGISLGLLGGGGTILTVPIFVYAGNMQADSAIAMSLVIVGLVSLIGALRYLKQGLLNKRLVFLFTISGMPTALIGAKFTSLVSSSHLLLLFGSLMCIVAIVLLLKAFKGKEVPQTATCRPNTYVSLAIGAAIGFLTGFLGVGGGFLIVPAISILMRCSLHTAVATSLAIIAINSLSGFVAHLNTFDFNPGLVGSLFTVMLVGALIGTKAALKLKGKSLQSAFAILILVTGVFLIFKNMPV
jgi:uncharacterized membrane protein YfcA